ncbi:hypothetical protein NJH78_18730 [Pseudomonas chlororaphis]|uniref:hypothetical protein n=1 Tax=Pseudomonas chlororaphis TaxID=587753 RepID=UPI00209B4D41|nr:hypothetical protein [Pseudomonas chlororaphis]MCO7572024.1 hypothetical protein [Pseudomonas chlororaphis]MCO7589804.1 hypothetical protein [Pseudomonas chlororaphis]
MRRFNGWEINERCLKVEYVEKRDFANHLVRDPSQQVDIAAISIFSAVYGSEDSDIHKAVLLNHAPAFIGFALDGSRGSHALLAGSSSRG